MDTDYTEAKQVLDAAAIDGLRELQEPGEPDLLDELVEMFVTDGDARIEAISQASGNMRASDVEREAHALKGASAVFGAEAVVDLCQRLQMAGRSGDLTGVPGLVERLRHEYERLTSALRAEAAQ
jgi:HPt (histidine-containing phosphotransfer) domain-containing protein